MSEAPPQSAPICVYGATGYTGRLVAAELHRRGADVVLAGRSAAKLEIVAEDCGAPPTHVVSLDDARGLHELLEPCAAVIACAGPFQRHGEPVLEAATQSATHYLDTTGEQSFMRVVFDRYGPMAERSGIALVTAMGFDYAPGDMIASLTAAGMGSLDEVVLAYATRGFGASRGTALSALGILAGGDREWREGRLVAAPRGVGSGRFDFPDPVGSQRMVRFPAGEHVTVPRHVDTAGVRTMMTASAVMPHPSLGVVAPLGMPALQLAARTPLRGVLAAAISRLPDGPDEEDRRRSRFTVVCEARRADLVRRAVVTGSDVYGLTARTVVEGALRCATPGFERAGALAPSQAFDPSDFLDSLRSAGVDYEVGTLP